MAIGNAECSLASGTPRSRNGSNMSTRAAAKAAVSDAARMAPTAAIDASLAPGDFIGFIFNMKPQPHRIQNGEGAGETDPENPGEIPHRSLPSSVDRAAVAFDKCSGDRPPQDPIDPRGVNKDKR